MIWIVNAVLQLAVRRSFPDSAFTFLLMSLVLVKELKHATGAECSLAPFHDLPHVIPPAAGQHQAAVATSLSEEQGGRGEPEEGQGGPRSGSKHWPRRRQTHLQALRRAQARLSRPRGRKAPYKSLWPLGLTLRFVFPRPSHIVLDTSWHSRWRLMCGLRPPQGTCLGAGPHGVKQNQSINQATSLFRVWSLPFS